MFQRKTKFEKPCNDIVFSSSLMCLGTVKTSDEMVPCFFFLNSQPLTGKELSIISIFANKCAFHVFEG